MQSASSYLLGHSSDELDRLAHQAKLFDADTRTLLSAAGIGPGARVLDLGCGVGDVAMIAGELVGPTGSVWAVDQSEQALEVGRLRAKAAKLDWVRFDQQDINKLSGDRQFDAVIGRFVLLHFADPGSVLLRAREVLKKNGVIAFVEMDLRSASVAPSFPLFEQCMGWIIALYEKSGLDPDSGSRLYHAFRTAGLQPNLRAMCRIEGGANMPGLNYVLATIRTMRPALMALGIASEKETDIETLRESFAEEIANDDHCVIFPRLIGAWARPADQ